MPLTLSRRGLLLAPLGALGVAGLAAALTYVMYAVSPLAALGAVVGVVVVVLIFRRPIYGVYAGFLSVPLEVGLVHVPGASSVTVAEVMFLLGGISGAIHMLTVRGWRPAPVHLPFLALILVAATGFLFAADTAVITRVTRVWLAYFFLSVAVSRSSRAELERGLMCLALAGAVVGAAAILTTGNQVVQGSGSLVQGRASTGFAHPNVLAFFLVMSMPQAIVLTGRGPLLQRLVMGLASVIIVAGLLLTLTRSALIGSALALVVLLGWSQFRRVVAVALLTVAVFAVANFQAIQSNSEVTVLSKRLSTVNASGLQRDPRIPIWKATPGIIASHPFLGVGEGNFSVAATKLSLLDPSDDLPYDHAHDIFLTFAAELGLIGLAVFCVWVYEIARLVGRNLLARDEQWPLKLGLASAMVGMLVTSLTEYPPRTNVIMATLVILIGTLAGFDRITREEAALDSAGRT